MKISFSNVSNIPRRYSSYLNFSGHQKPFYAVKLDVDYDRFDSDAQASKELNIDRRNINRCLNGEQKSSKGYMFINADELESKGADGKTYVDLIKMREMKRDYEREVLQRNAFYAIDDFGSVCKFYNKKEAGDLLDISPKKITECIEGKEISAGGYHFKKASEVELDGPITNEMIESVKHLFDVINPSVYMVTKGGCRRFESPEEASSFTCIPVQKIERCLKGEISDINNIKFIKGSDVESFAWPQYTFNNPNAIQKAYRDIISMRSYCS